MKYLKLIFTVNLFLIQLTSGAEGKSEDVKFEIKKGMAVTTFSKEDGFKLSDKAIENLDVSFTKLKGNTTWKVPKAALVRIKHSTGVYRKWDGWITMVLVSVLNQTNDTVTIRSIDLQNEDEIAISGVLFLRMTDADLNSDTVDSCTH